MNNEEEVVINESRAMIYIPSESVEAELTFKIFSNGELKTVYKKMNMMELQEAITDARNNYMEDDDKFVLTDKGRQLAESLMNI